MKEVCATGSTPTALRSHAHADISAGPATSRRNLNQHGFPERLLARPLTGQCAVGLQDERQSVLQVFARFLERPSLGVDAGDLFDVGRVPATVLLVDGGKGA